MTLFRPNRRYLDEAMAEVREITSLEEVRPSYAPLAKLTLEKYSYDKRINWDTYIALEDGNAFGFTNGPLKEKV